jgi:NAD(P)-dependent dehydrogenase (short-subunit alcohol dehydrogenase family)
MSLNTDKLIYKPNILSTDRILVTGGGTGLGAVMAEAYLMLGAEVYICGRRGDVLEKTANQLMEKHGGKVTHKSCDIRDPEAIAALNDFIWDDGGALTGLVNNAAGNFISKTEDLSINGFNAISDIVFRGTFYMTHDIGKRWIQAGNPGSVLSILTTWVWNGSPYTVPSAMSKTAIHAMTQSLAVEWGKYGIRLNAIAPGAFPTKGMSARLSPGKKLEDYKSIPENPIGRSGHFHELANLAVLLMAPHTEYINGQTIAVDGAQFQATGANFSGLRTWTDEKWAGAKKMIKSANNKDKKQRAS